MDKIVLKILRIACKTLLIFGIMLTLLFAFLYLSQWFWPQLWGCTPVGNNLYIVEWTEYPKLLYNDSPSAPRGRTIYSGADIIPPLSDQDSIVIETIDTKGDYIISAGINRFSGEPIYYLLKPSEINTTNFTLDSIRKHVFQFESIEFLNELIQ